MARTAGEIAGWATLAGLLAAAIAWPTACGPSDPDAPTGPDARALLAAVGPEVVVPTLDAAHQAATALEAAIAAWDAAERDGAAEASHVEAARAAWIDAMTVWQRAEVHQLGPAAPSASAVGGADGRDLVYSWPTVNPCRVDQETVRGGWSEASYFDTALVNVRGFDALEHLLWAGPDNACPGQVDINADGTWDALGEDGVRARRAAHAAALAGRLVDDVDALRAAWADDGGGFGRALADAGAEGSPYTSQQQALNAVFDALFYLETDTKDRKLALPLGLRDCTGDACADEVEGLASGRSVAWISANLDGFEALFTGGDGAGMDDLLDEIGHGALAARILDDLDAARAVAAAHDGPLDTLIREDRAAAQALHDAIKRLTDDVKGELATVLALQIPSEAAGDND